MPLTDREKRILQEIERNLSQEDPSHARGSRRSPREEQVRRIRLGTALFVGGFVTLIVFFILRNTLIGLSAFGLMVGGVVLAVGGTTALANDKLSSLQTKERTIGAFRRWQRALRDHFKRS
jgi:hypothetical protein